MHPHLRREIGPCFRHVGTDCRSGHKDTLALVVDKVMLRTEKLRVRFAVVFGSEDDVRRKTQELHRISCPLLGIIIETDIRHHAHIDVGIEFPQPPRTRTGLYNISRPVAHDNDQPVTMRTRNVDEIQVPPMGREEFADDKTGLHCAVTLMAGKGAFVFHSLYQLIRPRVASTRKIT